MSHGALLLLGKPGKPESKSSPLMDALGGSDDEHEDSPEGGDDHEAAMKEAGDKAIEALTSKDGLAFAKCLATIVSLSDGTPDDEGDDGEGDHEYDD